MLFSLLWSNLMKITQHHGHLKETGEKEVPLNVVFEYLTDVLM